MSLWRLRFLQVLTLCGFGLVAIKLGYWQLLAGSELETLARAQRSSQIEIPAARGLITSSDQFPLVTNKDTYLAYFYLPDLHDPIPSVVEKIGPLLFEDNPDNATLSGDLKKVGLFHYQQTLSQKLMSDTTWVPLARSLSSETKEKLSQLSYKGLGFEASEVRDYPEASMAAHLLGFVGSDGTGKPKGYFGLEGFYDLELTGVPGVIRQELDIRGKPIVTGEFARIPATAGRTIITHIDRSLQLIVETALEKGINRYQASAGEVIVMEPNTGAILAMAALPSYDPRRFRRYPSELYRNPAIADAYEPGSTFKVLVMGAAINEHLVAPETPCGTECGGPVPIGQYSIRTWNNQYHPGQTMTDVLVHSDNTGMVFVSRLLGKDKYLDYIHQFGFGDKTGIDLEGELTPPLRQKWGDIDLATGSFGQGIAVTSMQMVTAVNALASDGVLFVPQVAKAVMQDNQVHEVKPKVVRRVLSSAAVKTLSTMMEASALHGEAQWAALKGYHIAGKTGTAQVPIAGHYDADKTIASFVGFAPTTNPKFTMLVKLKEPQSSPWAAETAAPLWFAIAKDLIRYFNITSD